MKKLLLFILFCQNTWAANYIPLATGIQLYDVEVLVFARHIAQPDSLLFNNRATVDLDEVNAMFPADDMPWLIEDENQTAEDEQWQVPLEGEQTSNAKALAWFAFDTPAPQNPVYQKINQHPEMHALFYQKWRQPATPYRNPGYVKISNWPEDLINPEAQADDVDLGETVVGNLFEAHDIQEPNEEIAIKKTDFTMRGKVAFSKQRFQHGHVKVNLYRDSLDGESLVYLIDQDTQIDLNQWQYFDHPQFGVMMKVSLSTQFENPNAVTAAE